MNKLLGGILVGACVLSFGAAGCQKATEPKENAARKIAPTPPPQTPHKEIPPAKLALETDAIDIVLDDKMPVTKKVKVEGPAVKVEGAKDGLSAKLELASGVLLNLIAEPKTKLGKQTLTIYALGDQKATLTVDVMAAGSKLEGDKKGDKKSTDKKSDDKKTDEKKAEDK